MSGGVLEFLEDVCNISGHGDVAGSGLVVPLQGEAEVDFVVLFWGDFVYTV